jgi:hypothetical protein
MAVNNNNLKLHEISVRAVGVHAGVRTAHPVSTVHHSYRLGSTFSPPVVYTQSPGPNEARCGRTGKKCSEFLSGTNKSKSKPEERKLLCCNICVAFPILFLRYDTAWSRMWFSTSWKKICCLHPHDTSAYSPSTNSRCTFNTEVAPVQRSAWKWPYNWAETCSWNYNLIKHKVVYECIIYFLYYILAYIQQNGDVSLENYKH